MKALVVALAAVVAWRLTRPPTRSYEHPHRLFADIVRPDRQRLQRRSGLEPPDVAGLFGQHLKLATK